MNSRVEFITGLNKVSDVCQVLEEKEDAVPVAGGTALMLLMRQGIFRPRTLVSLKNVDELRTVEQKNNELWIGALVTQREIERSPVIQEQFPILSQAAHMVANVRIRNVATLGGTLCEADPQSDLPTVLATLNAEVVVASGEVLRSVPVQSFWTGLYSTQLSKGEVVTGVRIPYMKSGTAGVYMKCVTGPVGDRPLIGVAVLVCHGLNGMENLTVSVGGASPKPYLVKGLQELIRGQDINKEHIKLIAREVASRAEPFSDLRGPDWYRREMVEVFTERALQRSLFEAEGETGYAIEGK